MANPCEGASTNSGLGGGVFSGRGFLNSWQLCFSVKHFLETSYGFTVPYERASPSNGAGRRGGDFPVCGAF